MTNDNNAAAVDHPEHGRIAACRVLECIFALTPDGSILHHHLEEFDAAPGDGIVVYTFNGAEPAAERYRCQIIPPFVTRFPRIA